MRSILARGSHSSARFCTKHRLWTLAVFLSVFAATGCQTLPETGVKSFADATTTLKTSLKTIGRAAVRDMADVHTEDARSVELAKSSSAELAAEWDKRNKVIDAMERYAGSLMALVNAGHAGQANATDFVSSVQGLVDAAGTAIPAAAAAKPILQGAELIYGRIAEQIAAGKIQEAVEQADPIVTAVAELLGKDIQNLRHFTLMGHTLFVSQVKLNSEFSSTLKTIATSRKAATAAAFGSPPDPAALDRLKQLNDADAGIYGDPQYLEYLSKLNALDATFRAQNDLLDQAQATLDVWAQGHHSIVIGLQTKSAPSLLELTQMTQDLYTIYHDYRTERSKEH